MAVPIAVNANDHCNPVTPGNVQIELPKMLRWVGRATATRAFIALRYLKMSRIESIRYGFSAGVGGGLGAGGAEEAAATEAPWGGAAPGCSGGL